MTASERIIGVDESGKGDFFGPLVIAAVLVTDEQFGRLTDLGVRDSKKIAPKKLLSIADRLTANFPHSVIVIPPHEYNARYEEIRNLNKLLAWGHAAAIEKILESHRADRAISDKFGKPELIEDELARHGQDIDLDQFVRGEAHLPVAAASILARATFVGAMAELSEMCGVDLHKGAAPVVDQVGREVVRQHGPEMLRRVAKVHFKNYQRVINPRLNV